jgi:hypothetical protein
MGILTVWQRSRILRQLGCSRQRQNGEKRLATMIGVKEAQRLEACPQFWNHNS